MAEKPPSAELLAVLKDQAFDEIMRVAAQAESYARSTGEAAYRGEITAGLVPLKQLRLCCIAMIETYNELQKLEERNGQGVPAEARSPRAVGEGQRPSDGVA
jgi:hypothetical protein